MRPARLATSPIPGQLALFGEDKMVGFRNRQIARALIGGVALAAVAHSTAYAQDAGASDRPDNEPAGSALGMIIVTAQKRAENVQDTPIAITAISSDRIASGGLNNPERLSLLVPSLTNAESTGYSWLSIRGIGTNSAGMAEAAVASYHDSVYAGMQISQRVPTFDLERIEVLRGPQGTLYGRNTTGGVINYITKDPSFDFGATGDVAYGNYNTVETNVGVSGPLVEDKVAFRASFHYDDHDGYYENLTLNKKEYAGESIGGRLAVLIKPSDSLKLTLRGDRTENRSTNAFVLLGATSLDGGLSTTATPLGLFSQPAVVLANLPLPVLSPDDLDKLNGGSIADYYGLTQGGVQSPNPLATGKYTNSGPVNQYKTVVSGVSLTADWDVGDINVKSISAYRNGHMRTNVAVGGVSWSVTTVLPIIQREKQYTQEFDITGTSFGDKLDWLLGAFIYHNNAHFDGQYYLGAFDDLLRASYFLANPPGADYLFNLDMPQGSLPSLNTLPGVFPSIWQTLQLDGLGYPGYPDVMAGDVPEVAMASILQSQKSDSYAGFAQVTFHITDDLRVNGGIRYTIDKKNSRRTVHGNLAWDLTANAIYGAVQAGLYPPEYYNEDFIAGAGGLCDTRSKKTWKKPTGMIGLDYNFNPDVMTYAKASWGYKSGGMNNSECTNIYDPEYVTSYEAGLKAVFADGQILANVATYYLDYKNIQFLTFSNYVTLVKNAASAKAFGVELEYAVRPNFAPGWQFDGSASFEDSQYGEGCFGDPANLNNAGFLSTTKQACPATVINPTTQLEVPIGADANIKGNELIRAPRWKFNAGLQYDTDVADFGRIVARFDASWSDKYYSDVWNAKPFYFDGMVQKAYWVLGARLGWTSPDERYGLEVFGDNLTNERYSVDHQLVNLPPSLATVSGQLGTPRTYGIRFKAKLGAAY